MKSATVIKIGSLTAENEAERGRIVLRDIPAPELGDEQVRIKIAYCSICGTDPHQIQENPFDRELPFGLGHEMSGVITEVGKNAVKTGLKPGDRVGGCFLHFCGTCYYCRTGRPGSCEFAEATNQPCMSEYVTWHESQVYKIPDSISLKIGCLLEPVSVAVMAIDKLGPKIGHRTAICGGGPIGLLTLQLMKLMGAVDLTMIEPLGDRRGLAVKYGADHIIDPTAQGVNKIALEITEGRGYDNVIDCSGAVGAVTSLPDITIRGGTLLLVASYPRDYEMPLNLYKQCYEKQLMITGTTVSPNAFSRSLQIMSRMQLEDFITTIYELDEIEEAFIAQVSGKYSKILVRCNHFKDE